MVKVLTSSSTVPLEMLLLRGKLNAITEKKIKVEPRSLSTLSSL